MENKFKNWVEQYPDCWVNRNTNWVVKEISRVEGEQWIIIDNRDMMISCEWRDNKEECLEEADRICLEEIDEQ